MNSFAPIIQLHLIVPSSPHLVSFRLFSAELIFEVMLLACVIDGGVSHHELGLLSRTRKTIQRPDAWPSTMSAEDKMLHEDVLDTLIEERSHTWANVIRNGGHSFVRRNSAFL